MVATASKNSAFVPYTTKRPLHGCKCHAKAPAQVGALGLSLLSKFLKISQPGPNEFKLQTTPSEVKKAIAVAGPALALIPGYGKLAAAGAAIITAADQRQKLQAMQGAASAANAQDLVNQYSQIAGAIPGRAIGLSLINQIWAALVSGRAKAADAGYVINSCAKCTAGTVKDQTAKALSQGVTNPAQILDQFLIPEMQKSNKGGLWTIPTNDLERQILIDAIDATEAQSNSSLPITYGQPAPDAPAPTPAVPTSTQPAVPTLSIGSSPIGYTNDANGLPVFQGSDGGKYVGQGGKWVLYTGAIVSSPPGQTPLASSVTNAPQTPAPVQNPVAPGGAIPATVAPDQTAALIQQLMAQGASQQAAFNAAMSSLAAQGVNTSQPAVQQQVASDVAAAAKPQTAGIGGLSPTVLAIAGGLALVSFALARPSRRRK